MNTNVRVSLVETPAELAQCFEIRCRVFVEEQNVPRALELDDLDRVAQHVIALDGDGKAVGTARYYVKGSSVKIGRVAVIKSRRGKGIGVLLMEFILEHAALAGFSAAELNAQSYVVSFYERLGFTPYGDEFEEAGIPHRQMRLELRDGEMPREGV